MKKTIRKNKQLSLSNFRGAGRPAIHDPGIRHVARPRLRKMSSLHLTVKVNRIKAEIKNKQVLRLLKRAITNARKKGLRVIHYSLEYDHVHLLIEAGDNEVLGRGMQSFGVTFAKAINRYKKIKGAVYKTRYHFKRINSARALKNVMFYIFNNSHKHKTAIGLIHPYNSIRAEIKYHLFIKHKLVLDEELLVLLDRGSVYFKGLDYS